MADAPPLTPAQKALRLALIRSVHARRMRERAAPEALCAGVSERDEGIDDEGFEEPMTFADEERRELALDLAHENRRLRTILDTLARAGIGKGALVEVYADKSERLAGVVVCRADVDEMAFSESIREALEDLADALGGTMLHDSAHLTGVMSEVVK